MVLFKAHNVTLEKVEFKNKYKIYFISAVIGIIIFICIFGIRVLNPQYVDWLMVGGDLSQHYLGWKAYRAGKWFFPIGLTDRLAYPLHTSIIFTDSIPLLAVIFKILSPLLPADFQYFGLWGILCFVIQSILTINIIKKYTKNEKVLIAGCMLINLCPVMIIRMYWHTSLAGTWLILLAVTMLVYYEEYFRNTKKAVVFAAALGILVVSVHLYYLAMCGIVLVGYCLLDVLTEHKMVRSLKVCVAFIISAAIMVYLYGGFGGNSSAASGGLGDFSYNLNGFFNPFGWSSILPDLPVNTGYQIEGFAYLGVGIMLLCLITFASIVIKVKNKKELFIDNHKKIAAYAFILIIDLFAAASPVITFGSSVLLRLPLPGIIWNLWSVFRSSGRLIWVTIYLIVIWAVCADIKYTKVHIKLLILLFCFCIQFYDIHKELMYRYQRYMNKMEFHSVLQDDIWDGIGDNDDISHIVFADPLEKDELYSFVDYAIDHGKTVSDFYFAHASGDAVRNNTQSSLENPQRSEIFIFKNRDWNDLEQYHMDYYEADGYTIGYCAQE
ncbi:hypothetical protein C0033_08530 [Clostridium sp. chh4-2]|uniref:DUF6311 domain-containing protein n=1 Tax=Clostridium sp. chh4-2 TaxID=2067550 RepID=UPI000CCFBDCE|nr:DUF6311 domain-containing protein [Clostridium sp. chh4-2]PNV62594.1 hypothetical protein C0033_08530 [Clostridium sp. chh4-2]